MIRYRGDSREVKRALEMAKDEGTPDDHVPHYVFEWLGLYGTDDSFEMPSDSELIRLYRQLQGKDKVLARIENVRENVTTMVQVKHDERLALSKVVEVDLEAVRRWAEEVR